MNLHAKFDVFSSNRSRDMEGSRNFKSRLRDLSRPVNGGGGVVGDPIFGFLDTYLPIHYITFMGIR